MRVKFGKVLTANSKHSMKRPDNPDGQGNEEKFSKFYFQLESNMKL
jgi:hypothetical protein